MYQLTEDVRYLSGDESFSGGKVLLLSLITCGIYTLVWYYKLGELIAVAQRSKGVHVKDNGVLYLVLGLFGFGLVNMILAQSDANKLV